MANTKRVAVLGSTGSIGASTLDVIASHPQRLSVAGIAAHSNIEALAQQIQRFGTRLVAVIDDARAHELAQRCRGQAEVFAGIEGLTQLATHPDVDTVVVGTSGREVLIPLLRAIEANKHILLASKELLVMAGELIMETVGRHTGSLIPVDSEHAGLFQLLQGVPREDVERLILTGSGGSLWSLDAAAVAEVSLEQVLRHPKWQMGRKITVDSATLMNKGLEMIEARWLFGMPLERIGLVIHPQAQIHALLELRDGSCLAQMSICDMRLPIQYALSYPERWNTTLPRLRLSALSGLEFFEPDLDRFPCLRLGMEAAARAGSASTVLSAANDVAVAAFLQGQIPFGQIPRVIDQTLGQHAPRRCQDVKEIMAVDDWARGTAQTVITALLRTPVAT